MRTKLFILSLLVSITLPTIGNSAEDLKFKLIISQKKAAIFNPQQNIFKPSASLLAIEKIENAITESALGSLIPLAGQIGNLDPNNILNSIESLSSTKKDVNYLQLLKDVESAGIKILQDEIALILKKNPEYATLIDSPVIQDFYYFPWPTEKENYFYDNFKISQSKYKSIKSINPMAGSFGFEKLATKHIQQLIKTKLGTANEPVFLLGLRHYFLVDLKGKNALTIRALLGIKPNPDVVPKIEEGKPPVVIDRVVIPEAQPHLLVANLELSYELGKQTNRPTINITFGHFSEFKDGNFVLLPRPKHETGPRLEGTATHPLLRNKLAINFTFTDLVFDIISGEMTTVRTFLSPGLRISGTNHVIGKFHRLDVDEQFRGEINASIKAQANALMNKVFTFGGKNNENNN